MTDTDDLVKRLRADNQKTSREAAARIEAITTQLATLRNEADALREALVQAWELKNIADGMGVEQAKIHARTRLQDGLINFRRAAAFLAKLEDMK